MSQPPTGRARGRARGRGRASAPPPAAGPAAGGDRRPGEQAPPPRQPPPQQQEITPGRGRSRGGTTQPGGVGAAAAPPQQREDLSGQMAQMAIGAAGEGGVGGAVQERRPRRDDVIIEPSTRPENFEKKGNSGRPVSLVGNCFKLMTKPDWLLHQYRVDFDPQILNPRARFGLMAIHRANLGQEFTLDMDTMYSSIRLPEQVTMLTSERRDGTMVSIKVTHVSTLNPMAPNTLHLFNVIFRKVLKMIKMEQIGRHYYDPNKCIEIKQHGLNLWPGFITSILQYEKDVMLLCDISHKVLRTQTVLQVMYDIMQKSRGNFREEVKKKLIGEIVLTRYNNKTYRVDDIDFDVHPSDTFDTKQGPISYMDYFKKTYDRTIEDGQQPMIMSRPKKREEKKGAGPVYLPPELCHLTGLSDEIRSDFRVMRDLAQYTRVAPSDRIRTLTKFIGSLSSENPQVAQFLDSWGLKFDKQLCNFQARVLPPEQISQQQKTFSYPPHNSDWSRETRGVVSEPVQLRCWTLFYTRRDGNISQDFIRTLMKVGGPLGMNVAPPKTVELADDRAETYTRALQMERNPDSQIVVVILPSNRKDRYDAIKKICVVTHPVASQCIVSRTLSKQQQLMSVVTKIAMQMNCKMGGDLWRLEIPLSKLMIVGIDTYHDSAARNRSVFAFVASMNRAQTSYYSQCSFQPTHGEMGDAVTRHMTAALKQYHEVNGAVPDRVIVFRDGVGDSQMGMVVDYEVAQIITAMDKFYPPGTQHKLAVVVVKKRINNRFFMQDRGNMNNPPPGTVIDDVVTKHHLYDYFIISQSVRQGTVAPTSYNVVYDRTGLKPDHMQRLTYKLTHLYFNWAGTVRVPAPCMYAHKLAFLIGQSVHTEHHSSLSDKLFYL